MAKNSALTKITSEAKRICRANPGKKWSTAIQEASAKYRKNKKLTGTHKRKVSGVRQSAQVKKELKGKKQRLVHGYATVKRKRVSGVRKNIDRVDRKVTRITIAGIKSQGRAMLKERLDWLVVQKYHAGTKMAKRKLQRQISSINKELRKFAV